MGRIFRFAIPALCLSVIFLKGFVCNANESVYICKNVSPVVSQAIEEAKPIEIQPEEAEELRFTEEDIALIALVTMAEAEGECGEGKRLVIDTILNRVDSEYYPDTVHEVIYQPNQFSSMWNGRVDCCEVREDICELVREEIVSRTNHEVMFFTAGNYGAYGAPMFQVENHYFSSYE